MSFLNKGISFSVCSLQAAWLYVGLSVGPGLKYLNKTR